MDADWLRSQITTRTALEIARIANCSPTNVKYWVRRHGLKWPRRTRRKGTATSPRCPCGEVNPSNFYGHKKRLCKACQNIYSKHRGDGKRLWAISRLGGKCFNPKCGFDKYPCSLDIHHTDPNIKDEHFSGMRSWSYDRIEREIRSCRLLCRNCHTAFHCGLLEIDGA
jgi:hypothetical protein